MTPEAIKAASPVIEFLNSKNAYDGQRFIALSEIEQWLQEFALLQSERAFVAGRSKQSWKSFLESYPQASQAISDEDKKLDMQFIVMGGRTRYDELEHKGWDYKSFINGWMEGRVKMYQEIRDRLVNS